jgi:hypothetical protein
VDNALKEQDVQFKALKQDVLLQMFDPGLQDDETLPQSANLFAVGNRTGFFVCGCPQGTPNECCSGVDVRSTVWRDGIIESGF